MGNTSFVAHKTHLKPGDKAPGFIAKDQNSVVRNLSDYLGKIVILYFYPKDNTPACTATACSLRDEYKHLSHENYAVLGVSADSEKSHIKFSEKFELPFSLLVDTDRKIIKAYDVWGTKMLFGKVYDGIVRTTFIIDDAGIITHVINDVNTKQHAQQIMQL